MKKEVTVTTITEVTTIAWEEQNPLERQLDEMAEKAAKENIEELKKERKSEMKLGEMIVTDGVPQIEVHSVNREGEAHTYYLSPFRAYGFQVSETIDGLWSAGESEFFGLKHVVRNNSEYLAVGIMRAMSMYALREHEAMFEMDWKVSPQEQEKITKIAEASYQWVKALVEAEDKKQKQDEQLAQVYKQSAEQWKNFEQPKKQENKKEFKLWTKAKAMLAR